MKELNPVIINTIICSQTIEDDIVRKTTPTCMPFRESAFQESAFRESFFKLKESKFSEKGKLDFLIPNF